MAGIDTKSISELVDQLITTNIKCFLAQEVVMKETDHEKVAKAAKDAQNLNARRNQLMRAIDERVGEAGISVTSKTYA